MDKNIQNYDKSSFITLAISLVITIWTISFFEIIVKLLYSINVPNIILAVGYRLLLDIISVLLIVVFIYPIYYVFGYLKKPLVQMILNIVFSLLVIIQFAMTKYNFTTLINISADYFGFSYDDVFTNSTTSNSPSIFYFIPFIFFPFFYMMTERYFSNLVISNQKSHSLNNAIELNIPEKE